MVDYGEVGNYIEDYNNEYVNFKPNTGSTGCFNARNQTGNSFKNNHSDFEVDLKSRTLNKQDITVSTIKKNKSFTSNGLSFRDGSILMDKTTPVNLAKDIVKKLNQTYFVTSNKKCVSNTNIKAKKASLNYDNAFVNYAKEGENIDNKLDHSKIISSNAHMEENLFIKIFNLESFRGVKEKEMKVFDSDEENTKRQFQRSKKNLLEGINGSDSYNNDCNIEANERLYRDAKNNCVKNYYDNKTKGKNSIKNEKEKISCGVNNNITKSDFKENKKMKKNDNEKIEENNMKTKLMILATFACYQEGNAIFVSSEDVIFTFPIPLVGLKLKQGVKYSFAFNQKKFKKEKDENVKRVVSSYIQK